MQQTADNHSVTGISVWRRMPVMRTVLAGLLLSLISAPGWAAGLLDWSYTEVQLLTGRGFEFGSSHRTTFTFDHSDGWRYGGNYMFVDVYQRNDIGLEAYGEWYPHLSLNKITKRDISFGIFKDFYLLGGINVGTEPEREPFKAYFLGAGTSLDLSWADFFSVEFSARKADHLNTTGLQITPAWSIPFRMGKLKFKFRGFADYVTPGGSGGVSYLLTQPQLILDVGDFFNNSGKIYAGVEYWYWHNKFGVDGVEEHALQAQIIYAF
jgi:nucleoside-specific outer membrane channel protein Tsx